MVLYGIIRPSPYSRLFVLPEECENKGAVVFPPRCGTTLAEASTPHDTTWLQSRGQWFGGSASFHCRAADMVGMRLFWGWLALMRRLHAMP